LKLSTTTKPALGEEAGPGVKIKVTFALAGAAAISADAAIAAASKIFLIRAVLMID
jgi:hypothetical protein